MHKTSLTHSGLAILVMFGLFFSGCSLFRSDTLENAVKSENMKKVQTHLDAGANVNKANAEGKTPLHIAAENGHKEVAGVLIAKGAEVNAKDKEGRTPLHLATQEGYAPMVDYLTDKGANLNSQDKAGGSPLHYAVLNEEYDIAFILTLKNAMVNIKDHKKWTPLYLASLNNLPEFVELLIEKGAEINPTSGPIPLLAAVWNDHSDVVRMLLKHKAQVQGPPNAINTPMHMVAEKGFIKTANVLLDFQADPYAKDKSGKPPIYYATANGHYKMVRLLISYGEDVTQAIQGDTLLHLAAEKGHADVAQLLIEKGAVLNANNSKGDTPLDVAINHGQKKVANLITETAIERKKIQ